MGLATYGWKIVRVLGVKVTCITPCRGFTMETTTALVTAFGSYLGIPLSTTQTHVGSTTGERYFRVSLGFKVSFNPKLVRRSLSSAIPLSAGIKIVLMWSACILPWSSTYWCCHSGVGELW